MMGRVQHLGELCGNINHLKTDSKSYHHQTTNYPPPQALRFLKLYDLYPFCSLERRLQGRDDVPTKHSITVDSGLWAPF
jgi:hypothetical protein